MNNNSFYKRALLGHDLADRQVETMDAPRQKKIYTVFNYGENCVSFQNESQLNMYLRSKQAEYESLLNAEIQKKRDIENKPKRKASNPKKAKSKKAKKLDDLFDNYDPMAEFDIMDYIK